MPGEDPLLAASCTHGHMLCGRRLPLQRYFSQLPVLGFQDGEFGEFCTSSCLRHPASRWSLLKTFRGFYVVTSPLTNQSMQQMPRKRPSACTRSHCSPVDSRISSPSIYLILSWASSNMRLKRMFERRSLRAVVSIYQTLSTPSLQGV